MVTFSPGRFNFGSHPLSHCPKLVPRFLSLEIKFQISKKKTKKKHLMIQCKQKKWANHGHTQVRRSFSLKRFQIATDSWRPPPSDGFSEDRFSSVKDGGRGALCPGGVQATAGSLRADEALGKPWLPAPPAFTGDLITGTVSPFYTFLHFTWSVRNHLQASTILWRGKQLRKFLCLSQK